MGMARIFVSIDAWAGRTLFVPLIIRWCQQFSCSQYRVARVCWFIASLAGLYFATSVIGKVVFGLCALMWCLLASLKADSSPESSSRWFRMLVLCAALPIDGFRLLAIGAVWGLAWDVIVLVAEYAGTIRTIPPLEAKQKSAKLSGVTA